MDLKEIAESQHQKQIAAVQAQATAAVSAHAALNGQVSKHCSQPMRIANHVETLAGVSAHLQPSSPTREHEIVGGSQQLAASPTEASQIVYICGWLDVESFP